MDILEVGTPLLKSEGLEAVRALKRLFPDVPIADEEEFLQLQAEQHLPAIPGKRTLAASRGHEAGLPRRAALFGMEHLNLDSTEPDLLRQWLFAMSLGALFGLIVMLRRNLWTAALLHTWINALLLGAAPRWMAAEGVATAPPALYIGAALLSVFGLLYLIARLKPDQFMQR